MKNQYKDPLELAAESVAPRPTIEDAKKQAAEYAKVWLIHAHKKLIANLDGPDDVVSSFEIAFIDGYLTGLSHAGAIKK